MKKLFAILLIGLLSILTYSCGTTREKCREKYPCDQGSTVEKVVTLKEVVRDTVVYTMPDEGTVTALLRCDSLGNAYIKEIIDLKAVGKSQPPNIRIRDNIIRVVVPVDSQAVYMTLKDRYETTDQKTTVIPTPERINYLTGWQWFQIWVGRILGILLILIIAWLIGEYFYFKKKNDE